MTAPSDESAAATAPTRAARVRAAANRHRPPEPPLPGAPVLRGVVAVALTSLAVLTLAGGVLMLLLWRQEETSGVLTNQIERTWDLFDAVGVAELVVALLTVPFATAWMVVALLNVTRAAGQPRWPAALAITLPLSLAGVWSIRTVVIEESDDWIGAVGGLAIQALVLVFPLVAMEFGAGLVDARRRPHRAAYVIAVAWLAHMEFLGSLSTSDVTVPDRDVLDPQGWGLLAAYLILGALLQILGAMAVNESMRSFEEAAQHRYDMRKAFGEGVLVQAAR